MLLISDTLSSAPARFAAEELEKYLNLICKTPPAYTFELIDSTLPLYDAQALKNDPTIKGAFFEALLPLLEGGDPEQREAAALALRYGLAAIDNNDIIDF